MDMIRFVAAIRFANVPKTKQHCDAFSLVHANQVKVKFSLEQATKAQMGSRGIALLFL
jgi:hypothetical protein